MNTTDVRSDDASEIASVKNVDWKLTCRFLDCSAKYSTSYTSR